MLNCLYALRSEHLPGARLSWQEAVVLVLFGAGFKDSSNLRRLRPADAFLQRGTLNVV
jgi:hypothetical protein